MIWTIILLTLLVAGLVFLAVAIHNDEGVEDMSGFFATVFLTVSIMVLLVFVVVFIQANAQNSMFNCETRAELTDEVASLNATYECLKDGNAHTIVEITHYNDLVRQFQDKVTFGHMHRKNPWMNWFTSRVWDEFSVDDVKLYTP